MRDYQTWIEAGNKGNLGKKRTPESMTEALRLIGGY